MVTRREEILSALIDAAWNCEDATVIHDTVAGAVLDAVLEAVAKVFDDYGHDPFTASWVAVFIRNLKEERV
jgi:hypothetical protein